MVQRRLSELGPLFLRALCQLPGLDPPWNPTVRKMTLLVLGELEGFYDGRRARGSSFERACEEAFAGVDGSAGGAERGEGREGGVAKARKGTAKSGVRPGGAAPTVTGDMTSLRGAMGSWRPPSRKKKAAGGATGPPPSTVTGVAPWAAGAANGGGRKQPPVTVTGVAPWAVKKQPHGLPSMPLKSSASNALPRPLKKHISGSHGVPATSASIGHVTVRTDEQGGGDPGIGGREPRSALEEVRAYAEKLQPKGGSERSDDGVSTWAKAQMEESPTLLPDLKFHDLVFGRDLGEGAFGTVRYARRIVKTLTRSNWPEYAVKIISTRKISEMGYEQSVNREVAILRAMSHPGIARLVSSFRFRDGAYLILEYSSGGDLHALLRKNGSLDRDSTRFVVGSVAAALGSIHDLGFVYGDCKPENILITETGHIKITDFGGCRPVTPEAKALLKQSSTNLLKQLRDGDWKPTVTKSPTSGEMSSEDALESDEEDLRIEGTTAYLPPEVVIGGYPTPAADVWALGCVLFQCISGRPPILEDTDELTAQKIVSFNLCSDKQNFFGNYDASTFDAKAKALIQIMFHRDAECRPDILQIAEADFFDGLDIFSLHKKPAHPLDVGSIAPATDAKWSRRQFSSIWAPQPRAYNIGTAANHPAKAGTTGDEPISEGDEADEEFLPRQKALLLSKIRE
ncbi:hypothetical protein ACHAWF_011052 [Thalassiosira exigua]